MSRIVENCRKLKQEELTLSGVSSSKLIQFFGKRLHGSGGPFSYPFTLHM